VAAVVLHAVHVVSEQTNSMSVLVLPPQESTCSVATVASISHGNDFVSWLELHCNYATLSAAMAHQPDMTALLPATTVQQNGNPNGLCHHETEPLHLHDDNSSTGLTGRVEQSSKDSLPLQSVWHPQPHQQSHIPTPAIVLHCINQITLAEGF
jgi:hypothetical protein